MITIFNEVKLQGTKYVKCRGCNKKIRRQKTFSQTLNPYNKKNGVIKTRVIIRAELRESIEEWKKESEICQACSNK